MKKLKPVRPFAVEEETRLVREFAFHDQFVGGLVATDRYLVSSSEDAHIAMFDVETGRHLANLYGHDGPVNFLALAPDGHLLSAGDDFLVREWDLEARGSIQRFSGHRDYVSKVAAAGSKLVVSASRDNHLGVFDRTSGELVEHLPGHTAWIYGLAASPDGTRAVSASLNSQMIVWDLEALAIDRWLVGEDLGDVVSVMGMYISPDNTSGIGHEKAINAMTWSRDGKFLVSAANDVIVWDTSTWEETRRLPGHAWGTNALALFDGDTKLVTVGRNLKIWNIDSGKLLASFAAHGDTELKSVAVDPSERFVFTGDNNGLVRQWDLAAVLAKGVYQGHMGHVYPMTCSDDERLILTASANGAGILWDAEHGELLHHLDGHPDVFVTAGPFLEGGDEVITGNRGQLHRWSTRTGEELEVMNSDVSLYGFECIETTPTDGVLFCTDTIRRPTLWNLRDGTVRAMGAVSAFNSSVAKTRDGRYALTSSFFKRDDVIDGDDFGDDGESWKETGRWDDEDNRSPAQVWDLETGELCHAYRLDGIVSGDDVEYPSRVAWSPDEEVAYVGSSTGRLYGFARATEEPLFALNAHREYVRFVAVVDDDTLCSAGDGNTLTFRNRRGGEVDRLVVEDAEALNNWALSRDGRFAAATHENEVVLIDLQQRAVVARAELDGTPVTLLVTKGARRIAVGMSDGRVGFLKLEDGV